MLQSIDWSLLVRYASALVFGYLLGSIPFGILLTRLAGTEDIRAVGSGNIGATNVLRTGRKGLAAATLVGDALKGAAAVVVVLDVSNRNLALIAAFGAFLGHLFPVWLKFQGGKGVATYIGVLLALSWLAAVGFCLTWIMVAAVTRYSSLSGLVAAAATPAVLWMIDSRPEAQLFLLLTVVLWIRHRDNIVRLINGTEKKIGQHGA